MIYESNHAATTISSCIQVRNWGKKLCYLLPITEEENCSEEKKQKEEEPNREGPVLKKSPTQVVVLVLVMLLVVFEAMLPCCAEQCLP